MTSEEILDELAAQTDDIREFEGVTFELLEDYWSIADARLSAFSSDKMWAVAIEVVGYDFGQAEYSVRVWIFGNCLKPNDEWVNFTRTILTTPNAWNKEIEKNQIWGIARDAFAFRWRGKRFDFAPTLEELGSVGIELSSREIESGDLSPQQMLRFVCEKLDHPFFLSEDALRDVLNEHSIPYTPEYDVETQRSWFENELGEFEERPLLSTVLELVLQTRDWTHPKLGMADGEAGEWEISPHDAFATLAQTLAARDLAVWNAQDASKFNSHWRNWAEIAAEKEREHLARIAVSDTAIRAYLETLPHEKRAEFLDGLRPRIAKAPSVSEWGHSSSIRFKTNAALEIQIFRELLPAIDAMLLELRAPDESQTSEI